MNSNKPSNTLAIIGLVIGIIAILFSFIPCVGTIAFIPGLIGLILGVVAYMKAKDNGDPKGMALSVIIVSVLACAISVFNYFFFKNMATDMEGDKKEYTSCEVLTADYKIVKAEMEAITKDLEEDNASFSSISKIAKVTFKLKNIQEQSDVLGCDIDIEDFDPGSDGESEMEEADDEENEGEQESNGEGE